MPYAGTGFGPASDAGVQSIIALLGGVVPSGGTGFGDAQDASLEALYNLLAGGAVLPGESAIIRIPIALVTVSSVAVIPAGANVIVKRAYLDTSAAVGGVAYSPGATIQIGTAASPNLFWDSASDGNPQVADFYDKLQDTPNAVAGAMLVTIGGAPIAGAGFACVEFTKALS